MSEQARLREISARLNAIATELEGAGASDERAAALYRASGERKGRRLDLDQVLLLTIRDELVVDVVALPSDPDAFDAFWAD